MVKHHGIGRAGHADDGADGVGSRGRRGQREQRTRATDGVRAVGGRGPGGVGEDFGRRGDVHRDCAIALRPVGQRSVAGVDGESGQNSDIAGRGRAGSGEGGAAKVGAGGRTVASRRVGGVAEGCNFGIGCAPGEGRAGQGSGVARSNAEQRIDSSSGDGHTAAVIYGDRVSCLSVAPDLQVDGLNQTSCVRIGGAGGPGNAGKKLSDAGGPGGGLDLVEHGGSWGDHARVARRPAHGADGAGDVHTIAVVGDGLELPGLSLIKAVVLLLRWGRGSDFDDLNAVNVLVDVDGSDRAADAVGDGGYEGDSESTSAALGDGGVPGAGAGGTVAGHRERCGGVRVAARYDKLNVEAEDGFTEGILGAGTKALSAAGLERDCGAGAQGNARHASIAGVAAALAQAAGEGGDDADGQSKKKTGTATMHEPSSRPFARREQNVVGRKTVSVEGKEPGFKVSGFQSFKARGHCERSQALQDLETLKL